MKQGRRHKNNRRSFLGYIFFSTLHFAVLVIQALLTGVVTLFEKMRRPVFMGGFLVTGFITIFIFSNIISPGYIFNAYDAFHALLPKEETTQQDSVKYSIRSVQTGLIAFAAIEGLNRANNEGDKNEDAHIEDVSPEKPEFASIVRGPVKEEIKDAEFFSGSVFLGDSLSEGIINLGFLEDYATVIAQKGMTTKNAISEIDNIASLRPTRIFLMLGVNDLTDYNKSPESLIGGAKALISSIKEKCPDAQLVIQSLLPIASSYNNSLTRLTNEKIDEYNRLLKEYCESEGVHFAQINLSFKDENGDLIGDLSSDGIHLKAAYYKFWMNILMENTPK